MNKLSESISPTKNPPFFKVGFFWFVPTISGLDLFSRKTTSPSIVGADAFHFSVRNGKRWCHIARKTQNSGNKLKFDCNKRQYSSPFGVLYA